MKIKPPNYTTLGPNYSIIVSVPCARYINRGLMKKIQDGTEQFFGIIQWKMEKCSNVEPHELN